MKRIIERINRIIPASVRSNKSAAQVLALIYKLLMAADTTFANQIEQAIEHYPDSNITKKALYSDMLNEFVTSWILPVEYARFKLFGKTTEERKAYIADHETVKILKWTKGNNILPETKYERFQMFNHYFRRQIVCISTERTCSETDYRNFIINKDKVIVKPLRGTKGHCIRIVDSNDVQTLEQFKQLFEGEYLVEELIDQGEELKQFHPQSVNTVRFVTGIDRSGGFHHLFALVRFGVGESFVDNVSSGGMVALVDMKKGEICSPAYQGTSCYDVHPDTGLKFEGTKIPQWDYLCMLVKDIHLSQPGQRVFGFDMAWTTKGWDLVEVNPAPSLDSYQQLTGFGIRPYLIECGIL